MISEAMSEITLNGLKKTGLTLLLAPIVSINCRGNDIFVQQT